MPLDDAQVRLLRNRFPALSRRHGEFEAIFFDGPAGTQVPQEVIDAIGDYLACRNANHDGVFATSIESDAQLHQAHVAAADLVGTSDSAEVAFGANMTTMTLALSRALARSWRAGDEIIVTRLEHDANFTPWVLAAEDSGATVRYVDINPDDCTLRLDQLESYLNERTRLIAVGCASNAVGTVNPVKRICAAAKSVGAFTFLDAVHYAPHDLIDVQDWGCDFLACSAYKFFGPHVGILFGRRELLESIRPYKLRPSPEDLPGRWMTGTQNHECIAGVTSAINYIAELAGPPNGDNTERNSQGLSRRDSLRAAYHAIRDYETGLSRRLLEGLESIDEIKVWGITDRGRLSARLPTFSITHQNLPAKALAQKLADAGIFAWHGNYYALPLTQRLGVEPEGMVRIGMVHYNTVAEIDRLVACLRTC